MKAFCDFDKLQLGFCTVKKVSLEEMANLQIAKFEFQLFSRKFLLIDKIVTSEHQWSICNVTTPNALSLNEWLINMNTQIVLSHRAANCLDA